MHGTFFQIALMLRKLQQAGMSVAGVDFDPDNVTLLRAGGLKIYFGDSEDPDFLDTLPLAQVQWAISALPLADASRSWLHALRAAGYRGRVGVVVRDATHARAMRHEAVDWVLNPFEAAADHAAHELALKLRGLGPGPGAAEAAAAPPAADRPDPHPEKS